MSVFPAATGVTTPELAFIVALDTSEEYQVTVPPAAAVATVIVEPIHTDVGPVIAVTGVVGKAVTVIVLPVAIGADSQPDEVMV